MQEKTFFVTKIIFIMNILKFKKFFRIKPKSIKRKNYNNLFVIALNHNKPIVLMFEL